VQGLQRVRTYCLANALIFPSYSTPVMSQTNPGEAKDGSQEMAKERDGQHDFDFEVGTWKIHPRRLLHPLTMRVY
jgi:hypothetical protein